MLEVMEHGRGVALLHWRLGARALRGRRRRGLGYRRCGKLGHKPLEVERVGGEGEVVAGPRPLTRVAVPGKLDPVEVGVMQVEGFVGAVVGGAVDLPAVIEQAFEGDGEIPPGGVVDREVVEAGGARRWWGAARALPGVQGDVDTIG